MGATADKVVSALALALPEHARLLLLTYRPLPSVRVDDLVSLPPADGVARALRHMGYREEPGLVEARDAAGFIHGPVAGEYALGLDARVYLGERHVGRLPLLDFVAPVCEASLHAVIAAGRALTDGPGVVLVSGRSYHWYGERLLSLPEWRTFMARSLLLGHLVDARWVGHCLIESSACLRVTAGGTKAAPPKVVAIVP